MKSILILMLISLGMGLGAFILFLFSSRGKQFDDIEGPKYRMLNDDEDEDDENSVRERKDK